MTNAVDSNWQRLGLRGASKVRKPSTAPTAAAITEEKGRLNGRFPNFDPRAVPALAGWTVVHLYPYHRIGNHLARLGDHLGYRRLPNLSHGPLVARLAPSYYVPQVREEVPKREFGKA